MRSEYVVARIWRSRTGLMLSQLMSIWADTHYTLDQRAFHMFENPNWATEIPVTRALDVHRYVDDVPTVELQPCPFTLAPERFWPALVDVTQNVLTATEQNQGYIES